MNNINEKDITQVIAESITKTFKPILKDTTEKIKKVITEATILIPKTFILKTEFQSPVTKEVHEKIYQSQVEAYNKISSKLDTVSKEEAKNPNNSDYRRLKLDEQHNLNGIKLHELYFSNISDLHSEIKMNSLTYMRLSRDWGSFENWQFDFVACAMSATEGWAICYYDPFKQKYFNTFIEKNVENIPLCGIPIIVLDTHHHVFARDFYEEKINYVYSCMKELNFSVIEARLILIERSNLHVLFDIIPLQNTETNQILLNTNISNQPPIDKDQIAK